jgi:cytochrome c oxidase subunit III
MKDIFQQDGNKDQIERAKKNLVYVGIVSVFMLFAGLSSAYIVSMGDSFWLKFPLPKAFWISTAIIVFSSIVFQFAVSFARKGNKSAMKGAIAFTLILGLAFVYFQFKGYGQLVDNGIHAVNNSIIVTDGKYGDYYSVKYKGDYIEINGNEYLVKGKKMTSEQVSDYQKFMSQFLEMDDKEPFKVTEYGGDFILIFEDYLPLEVKNEQLFTSTGEELQYLDRVRLKDLAVNVKDLRGDFFVRGELGKDFHIYYKGKELEYFERELQLEGKKLKPYLQIKAMEAADTSSSYLYMMTFLHLLHIIVTIFYMMKLVIHSFSGRINSENNISMRMGAIFWHFLGLLWLYLLLFLLFIH